MYVQITENFNKWVIWPIIGFFSRKRVALINKASWVDFSEFEYWTISFTVAFLYCSIGKTVLFGYFFAIFWVEQLTGFYHKSYKSLFVIEFYITWSCYLFYYFSPLMCDLLYNFKKRLCFTYFVCYWLYGY